MSAPLLEVERLQVSISGQAIVRDISFAVAAGEKLALVGESGSGKTVTALSLLRLFHGAQVDGHAWFGEAAQRRDLLTLSERRLRAVRGDEIAMIFQEPMSALNPLMTVGTQIAEVLQLKRATTGNAAMQGAVELLARMGLDRPAERAAVYPHQLSGGMRQRVGLARALAIDAEIILMDEAFSALDPLIRYDMQDELLKLQQQLHKTIVFVTHDIGEALRLGDHIVILRDGRVEQAGSPQGIIARPANDYVRRFVMRRE